MGNKSSVIRRLAGSRAARAGLAIALAAAIAGVLALTDVARDWEADLYDLRVRSFFEPKPSSDVVVVEVEHVSNRLVASAYGPWPYPRAVWAGMLSKLRAAGARAVVFDIQFPNEMPQLGGDREFAREALALGNVSAVAEFFSADADVPIPADPDGVEKFAAASELPSAGEYPLAQWPYPRLRQSLASVGTAHLRADPDGVVRRMELAARHAGRIYPALWLTPFQMDGTLPAVAGPLVSKVGEDSLLLIRFRGRPYERFTHYPLYRVLGDLLDPSIPPLPDDAFRGRIVVIGTSVSGTYDIKQLPWGLAPGAHANAAAIDTALGGDPILRLPRWTTVAACGALIFLGAFLMSGAGFVALRALGAAAGGLVYAAGAFAAYRFGYWADLFLPLAGLAASIGTGALVGYFTVTRRVRQFKDAWSKYVSPDVVELLSRNIDEIRPEVGERRELTVLFSDVIGFTPLSEKYPPEEVIRTLNEYFKEVVPVIFRHRGTLDKYVGDCIMAIWGAPQPLEDHAVRACRAALDMARALDELKKRRYAQGRPPLDVGIGINTGEMVVGNIGSVERLDYTVIGDNVNTAARLESLTREKKVRIIISEATYRKVADIAQVNDLGLAKLKGKAEPIHVYELLGLKPDETSK